MSGIEAAEAHGKRTVKKISALIDVASIVLAHANRGQQPMVVDQNERLQKYTMPDQDGPTRMKKCLELVVEMHVKSTLLIPKMFYKIKE